ncbi:hypothetical protein ACAX43_05195 [Paraburkholderia sp. IW21]
MCLAMRCEGAGSSIEQLVQVRVDIAGVEHQVSLRAMAGEARSARAVVPVSHLHDGLKESSAVRLLGDQK